MTDILIYPAGSTAACRYAAGFLETSGIQTLDHPAPEITHLLLDVPSFDASGNLRCGDSLESLLERLPQNITVIGGNLSHPGLTGYKTMDLLQHAGYLAYNAAITAQCVLQVAAPLLDTTLADSPALIIGWGRIGKCLGQLLRAIGTDTTIAVRKESDKAMIRALGLKAVDISDIPFILPKIRLIFNTAPAKVLGRNLLAHVNKCIKIELASMPGLDAEDVVIARGLPGTYAPESSGHLIAQTALQLIKEDLS